MMHHSFEHMEFEKEVLKQAKNLLKTGGKLLIRIPVVSKVLFEKYGACLVSIDAPRHFYIHSMKSINTLCSEAGLRITHVEYDADEFSFWASEQYARDICLSANNSYARSRENSIFSKKQIQGFKKEIKELNIKCESDNAAFYITSL
jgi:predicted SAM-dependent methyltransferase